MDRPLSDGAQSFEVQVIGVSGPSCSGKSTFSSELSRALSSSVVLEQDLYFRDPDECPAEANFCELQWLRLADFVESFQALAKGAPADIPVIDFLTFRQVGKKSLAPARVLIVEGMTVFRIQEVFERCDYRFYLSCDFQTLEKRKRDRDTRERGKPIEVIEAQLRWMREEYLKDQEMIGKGDVQLISLSDLPGVVDAVSR